MPKKIKLTPYEKESLERIKRLIEEQPEEMPTLAQLCRHAALNSDKLKRGFKLLFGYTPHGYHLYLKMQEARRLLRETDKPVCEIAWALGYRHSSSFCYAFRLYVGVRPGEVRGEVVGVDEM